MKNLENELPNLETKSKNLRKESIKSKPQIQEELKEEAVRIAEAVCKYYGVKYGLLMSNYRGNKVIPARQMAMYIVKRRTDLGAEEIASIFQRDRTSFLYSYAKIDTLLRSKVRDDIKEDFNNLNIII